MLKSEQEKTQFENMRKEVVALLEKFAQDNHYHFEVERCYSSHLEVDYYFDREDKRYLNEKVEELIKTGVKDKDELHDVILDILWDNEQYSKCLGNQLQDEFLQEYREELTEITNNWELFDETDLFYELNIITNYIYDIDSVIDETTLNVLVVLENEDAFDTEFGNNNFMDMLRYARAKEEYEEWLEDSSVKLLLQSQGYTLEQLIEYLWYDLDEFTEELDQLRSDEVFCSIVQEIENAQNYQSLVKLTQMSVDEYFKAKELESYTISKDSVIGYIGLIDGSGSVLEVNLNNDIVLQKGEFKIKLDGAYGYSVANTYGIDFSYL